MPNNPSGERTDFIFFFAPTSSTRQYQYTIKDSLFYDRNSDPEVILGIAGHFNEEVLISNVTISSSQIAQRATAFFRLLNLTIDGLHFDNNVLNGDRIIHINF